MVMDTKVNHSMVHLMEFSLQLLHLRFLPDGLFDMAGLLHLGLLPDRLFNMARLLNLRFMLDRLFDMARLLHLGLLPDGLFNMARLFDPWFGLCRLHYRRLRLGRRLDLRRLNFFDPCARIRLIINRRFICC